MQTDKKGVTLDDLQNGYYIYQAADGFKFGVDAVFLSEFAKVKPGEAVLDLGCGNGIIPILLAAKTKGRHFFGLEIQENSVHLADKSVEYNKLRDRITIIQGDICEASKIMGTEAVDVIVCNPPYMIAEHGLKNKNDEKYIARHEVLCTFEDIAREASKVIKSRGRFYCIHRPLRLAELIVTLTKHALEPKRFRFIHPYVNKEPSMVMIEAVKGANKGTRVDAPLVVCEDGGEHKMEAIQCIRSGR